MSSPIYTPTTPPLIDSPPPTRPSSPLSTPIPIPLDLTPHLTTWLTTTHSKISAFWIGATWRPWARYELYHHFTTVFPLSETTMTTHTLPAEEFWPDISNTHDDATNEETITIDLLIEPTDPSHDGTPIAIILRCERVNENEGSFERFRAEMDADIERVKGWGGVFGGYEGLRVLVVGFSGPVPSENEETEWRVRPVPRRFEAGEVSGWVAEVEIGVYGEGEYGRDEEGDGDGNKERTSETA